MKAKINGIEFEGTPEEFVKLIGKPQASDALSNSEVFVFRSSKQNQPEKQQSNVQDDTVVAEVMETYLTGTTEFVRALYRYRPKFGGSSYVLQTLATGKVFTVRSLAQKAGVPFDAVYEVLQRSLNAGCQIGIDNNHVAPGTLQRSKRSLVLVEDTSQEVKITSETKVRFIALGTVEQAKATAEATRLNMRNSKTAQHQDAKAVVISTGSPPITKIRYNS